MTAPIAPGTAGAHRRRRLQLLAAGGIVAALLALGMAAVGVFASPKEHPITCDNYKDVITAQDAILTKYKVDSSDEANKAKWNATLRKQEAENVGKQCPSSTPTGNKCDGVTFSPYAVAGSNRFGKPPVDIANPGPPRAVANAFVNQFKTSRWLSASWSQATYLVDGGITSGEVQAKAQSFVEDFNAWRATNIQLRGIMSRATFDLRRDSSPYATQEAVINGSNQCIAPAVRDVGTQSRGTRLVLVIHMAQADGGRTIEVVVDCDGQIHIVGPKVIEHHTTTTQHHTTTTQPHVTTTQAPPPPPPPTTSTTTAPPTTTTTPPPPTTAPCTWVVKDGVWRCVTDIGES